MTEYLVENGERHTINLVENGKIHKKNWWECANTLFLPEN